MKKDVPKISIVTTTYNLLSDNREKLFKACMESVHNQTYTNIEHIIIDGASDDGSLEIIKEYEQKGWCKVFSEKDQGVDDAYNKGTMHATGKYIAWMNSDDSYYDKHAIASMVEALEENNADYCYGKQMAFDRNGKCCGVFEPKVENFWKNMPFSHQTLAVRKSVLENLGGYDTKYGIGGDYFLVLQLILNDFKGIYIDKILSHYTLGGFSSSFNNRFRVYTCTSILAKRMCWLFKQFYPAIDEDQAQYIYWYGEDYKTYPKMFLQKFIRFMVEKKLKNFNYNQFIDYLNSIIGQAYSKEFSCEVQKYYILDRIKFLTIKIQKDCIRVRLFNVIPLLKIKKHSI